MTEPPRPTDPGTGSDGSAPWERPRRWSDRGLDATRVDDLLAKLGTNSDEVTGRRSRRRQAQETERAAEGTETVDQPDESTPIAASDLIAALGAPSPDEVHDDDTAQHDETAHHDETTQDGTDQDAEGVPAARDEDDRPDADRYPERPPSLALQPPTRSSSGADESEDLFAVAPLGGGEPARYRAQDAVDQGVDPAEIDRDVRIHDTSTGAVDPNAADSPADDTPTVTLPQYSDDVAAIRASLLGEQLPTTGAPIGATNVGGPPAPPRGPGRGAHSRGGDDDRRSKRGFLAAGRSIIAALAVVVLLYSGFQWLNFQQADQGLRDGRDEITLPSATPTPGAPPAVTGKTTVTNSQGVAIPMYPAENILLLGSDSRAGDNGNAGNSDDSTADSANSDTMMVAHVSGDRQTVSIISFPRYLDIPAPTCKTWDFKSRKLSDRTQPVTATSRWRISNAYAVGGPACAAAAVTKVSGIHIDRIIDIDFYGFQTMVDALDGVTVNICRPIIDAELQTVVPNAGVQVIRGEQALNLVRARKVQGDSTGTDGRMRRQQVVLSAMLRQVTSAGTLLNPIELNAFLTAFTNSTHTSNITLDSLILFAKQLGSLEPGKVNFYSIPHHPSATRQDWDELDPSAQAIFKALRNDERLPTFTTPDPNTGDTVSSVSSASSTSKAPSTASSTSSSSPATSTTTSTATTSTTSEAPQVLTVDPGQIDLQVVNETGRSGVATTVMEALNEGGFDVTDNDLLRPADEVADATTVEYSANGRDAAVMVASSVPNATIVKVDGLGSRVRLVLGSSFDGTISPAAVGDPVPDQFRTTPAPAPSTPSSSSTSTSRSSAPESSGAPAPSTTPVPSTAPTTVAIDTSGVQAVNAGDPTCA